MNQFTPEPTTSTRITSDRIPSTRTTSDRPIQPTLSTRSSVRRRSLLFFGLTAALVTGLASGLTMVRAANGGQPLPGYPPNPGIPYPYPCYPPCPGIIYYPSGCATPFAPLPPETTPMPIPPGATPPAPPPLPLSMPLVETLAVQAIPSPTPGGAAQALEYKVCPQKAMDIPQVIQDQAMAEPWTIYGYGMKRNPNVPEHPLWNSYRHWLSTRNQNQPYSVCNPAIWKAGCP